MWPLATQAYTDILSTCIEYEGCNDEVFNHSNQPAKDARLGLIYTFQGKSTYLITDKQYEMDFSILDSACACPACKDGFTRAYFHHLYVHTPLLCQRWLVMHNKWVINQQSI